MGGGGWVWVEWGAGSSENKANLAQLGLELGLSLAKMLVLMSCVQLRYIVNIEGH